MWYLPADLANVLLPSLMGMKKFHTHKCGLFSDLPNISKKIVKIDYAALEEIFLQTLYYKKKKPKTYFEFSQLHATACHRGLLSIGYFQSNILLPIFYR